MPVKGMGSRLSGLIVLVDAGFVVNHIEFSRPVLRFKIMFSFVIVYLC